MTDRIRLTSYYKGDIIELESFNGIDKVIDYLEDSEVPDYYINAVAQALSACVPITMHEGQIVDEWEIAE